jgi:hypothetical protein
MKRRRVVPMRQRNYAVGLAAAGAAVFDLDFCAQATFFSRFLRRARAFRFTLVLSCCPMGAIV